MPSGGDLFPLLTRCLDSGFIAAIEQVGEVVDLAVAEMRDVVNRSITAGELDLAKQQTVSSILLGLEDSAARAATLAQSEMLHGRQIAVDEAIAKINAVTSDEINALIASSFTTDQVAFAALGDIEGLSLDRKRFAI